MITKCVTWCNKLTAPFFSTKSQTYFTNTRLCNKEVTDFPRSAQISSHFNNNKEKQNKAEQNEDNIRQNETLKNLLSLV